MPDRPTVFVSSTCYDLAQIREDLRIFIESQGLVPLLSDHRSFPVDPDLSTIENCRKVVREHADLFVLVVGARYGTIVDAGRSITNIEYSEAVRKGIPISAFIQKAVLTLLPVWRSNPSADFSGQIESPRLFEFVESLYGAGERWVFAFERAEDITSTLRDQGSRLLKEGLDLRRRLREAALPPALATLTGEPLRVLIDRPEGWEYQLVSAVLEEEELLSVDLRRDYALRITLGEWRSIRDEREVVTYLMAQVQAVRAAGSGLAQLASEMEETLGPPGQPGDPGRLVYATRRMGSIHRGALEQAMAFRRVHLNEKVEELLPIVDQYWRKLVENIEGYVAAVRRWARSIANNEEVERTFTFEFAEPTIDAFHEITARVALRLGIPPPPTDP